MINTLINLCSKISQEPDSIRFHVYGRSHAAYKKDVSVFLHTACIAVKKGGSLIYSRSYINENVLDKAYTLRYRENPSDTGSTPPYFIGDFDVRYNKNGEHFSKERTFLDHFEKGSSYNLTSLPSNILDIRAILLSHIDDIESFIDDIYDSDISDDHTKKDVFKKSKYIVYVHLDMTDFGYNHFYECPDIIRCLDSIHAGTHKDSLFSVEDDRYVLKKTFFSQLCSGDKKNDNQFTGFDPKEAYKSFYLVKDNIGSIYYYKKILDAMKVNIPNAYPLTIRLIPHGDYGASEFISYTELLSRFNQKLYAKESPTKDNASKDTLCSAEEEITSYSYKSDLIFDDIIDTDKKITSFDLSFVREEKAHITILTIPRLDKSFLLQIYEDMCKGASEVHKKFKSRPPSVLYSFYLLLSGYRKERKDQYCGHVLKVLPKIFTGQYYRDPDIFQNYIDTRMESIRDVGYSTSMQSTYKKAYNLIKQLLKGEISMSESKSLSRDFGEHLADVVFYLSFVIKSFEKHTVGYLTRRVDSIKTARRMLVDLQSRVILHKGEKVCGKEIKFDSSAYTKATEVLGKIEKDELSIDRYEFADSFLNRYGDRIKNFSKED